MNTEPVTSGKTSKAPTLKGVVVSNAMQQTIVVKVDTLKTHPKYQKQYRSSKRYKVHVEAGKEYALGTVVEFQECRPMSRDKRHAVIA